MRHEPPSHHKKLVILMFLLRAAVVSPMMGRRVDACGVDCPIYPCAHIVGADDIMIDPMHCTPWFDVIHYRPPAILH